MCFRWVSRAPRMSVMGWVCMVVRQALLGRLDSFSGTSCRRHGQRTLKVEAVNAGKLGTLQPLALFQPDETLAVTFDERAPDGSMRGIFLWQRLEGGEELVVSGGEGRVGFSSDPSSGEARLVVLAALSGSEA